MNHENEDVPTTTTRPRLLPQIVAVNMSYEGKLCERIVAAFAASFALTLLLDTSSISIRGSHIHSPMEFLVGYGNLTESFMIKSIQWMWLEKFWKYLYRPAHWKQSEQILAIYHRIFKKRSNTSLLVSNGNLNNFIFFA